MRSAIRLVPLAAAWAIATLALLAAQLASAGEPLAHEIESVISADEFAQAQWGIQVSDLETGEILYARQPERLFVPASTTKLYSVATALDRFGPDHRFETPIYARGEIDSDGRLNGDLILVASGDLTMGGRTDAKGRIAFKDIDHTYAGIGSSAELTEEDPLAGMKDLARQVADSGIARVDGNVLIDDRLFDSAQSTGSGPGRLVPILVNDNCIDLRITPTRPGQPAKVEWRPECRAITTDLAVDTVAGGEPRIEVWIYGTNLIVRGRMPADRPPLVLVQEVPDAATFARAVLIEALEAAGVEVAASEFEPVDRGPLAATLPPRDAYTSMRHVAKLVSPPFSENAKLILKVSLNLHASTLPLLVAASHGERTLTQGLRRQHEFLKRIGVPVDTISFGGGAGGDRADYVTPQATVALLRHMATRDDFDVYHAALPILGVDGTLAQSVSSDSPAKGNIQAKTGTLGWFNAMNDHTLLTSKALAGYATAKSGRRLAFAMFVNNVHLRSSSDRDRIGRVLGSLCEKIYDAL